MKGAEMNRETRYRAWDKKCLSMHEVRCINLFSKNILCAGKKITDAEFILGYNEFFLMQFTGFKDVDTKNIYEGDIVQFLKFDDISLRIIGVVEYYSETASFIINCKSKYENLKGEYYFKKDRNYTIVGNIFEHPELLKQ